MDKISARDLVGSWRLESWTIGYSGRDAFSNPFGDNAEGLLIYAADGWMSVAVSRGNRPPFPEDVSPRQLPEKSRAAAWSSYFHYAGQYRVSGGDIVHRITQSLNPNMVGTEQLRHAELDGRTLVLSGKEELRPGVSRLHSIVWHRIAGGGHEVPVEDG